MDVPTLTVVGQNGDELIINEADYTPERYTLWGDRDAKPASGKGSKSKAKPDTDTKPAAAEIDPATLTVTAQGDKWVITGPDATALEGTRYEGEFDTDAEAWAVIFPPAS